MSQFDLAEHLVLEIARLLNGWSFRPSLRLIGGLDEYGHRLETELSKVLLSKVELVASSSKLSTQFAPDGTYGQEVQPMGDSSALIDIIDFSGIVLFGESADGAPFCFDFRSDASEPSIIWWDDDHWRRIAKNLDGFVRLFVRA